MLLSLAKDVLKSHIGKHISDPVEIAFTDIKRNSSIVADRLGEIKWSRLQETYRKEAQVLAGVFPQLPENTVQFRASWGNDNWAGLYAWIFSLTFSDTGRMWSRIDRYTLRK